MKKPIKIAIIIPNITLLAGTERAVCNLANILANNDAYLPIIISICSVNGEPCYYLNDRVNIFHCAVTTRNKYLARILQFKQVKIICDTENIDIVIGTYSAINILLPFISIVKKRIAMEHMNYASAAFIVRIIRRLFYPFLDAIVLLTNADAANYKFHKNAVIIPNSLPFISQEQSLLENKVILAVGRLTYQKGFERLVEAIALIKEKCCGWQVRIIGDGEDKVRLLKQIKECDLENTVTILPPTKNIESEYCNASIYVMSSRYEGFGLVLIEAKAYGLPIISFDCTEGPAEIIRNGIDGFLIEKDNIELLSQAILKLMEDEELRKKFGKEATKDIDRFKPEHIGIMWDKLFTNLINTAK
jgi:glycosyltransferase involved in cell wall biosynthesis